MRIRWIPTLTILAVCTTSGIVACTGVIGDGNGDRKSVPREAQDVPVNPNVQGVGKLGMRRLTRAEYANTIRDLFGNAPQEVQFLPEDRGAPFDNEYRSQIASQPLIDAAEMLAEKVAASVLADPARKSSVVGCVPTKADDATCMRSFVTKIGRRVLRRTLTEGEISKFASLTSFGVEQNDFYAGVSVVLRAMLQHPEFLYRIEIGTPVPERPGLFRLTGFEVATRLSYFLWGTTPSDALLDLAESKHLSTPEQVRAAATDMVKDKRTKVRIEEFHSAWLNLGQVTADTPELARSMRDETTALVDRVILDRREAWKTLFTTDETFADERLAKHYGLPAPGGAEPKWVSYGASGRRGILSHASFLANGAKFGDTSPTRRGKMIRNRLFCQEIPPPPPETKVDDPPPETTSKCKADRYKAHAANGTCKGCHEQMDPIGFGIENFDTQGRYRATDKDAPNCPISGKGELVGVGTFQGPAGLADLLVKSGQLEPCVVKQVYRFAWGRGDEIEDQAYVSSLTQAFREKQRFDELLLELVSTEAFGYRREE